MEVTIPRVRTYQESTYWYRVDVDQKAVYAMMQPPPLPFPSASMGGEAVGSESGTLEATEKCRVKKSIGVCVLCAG